MRGAAIGPGFAAVWIEHGARGPSLAPTVGRFYDASHQDRSGLLQVSSWGGPVLAPGTTILLSQESRRRDRAVTATDVGSMLSDQPAPGLSEMLPTFGAVVRRGDGTVVACTDALGFHHLYTRVGIGWAAVSTSARVLGALGDSGFDLEGVAVQSLLGWQLGDRTLFRDVTKLGAGSAVTMSDRGMRTHRYASERGRESVQPELAVPAMRDMLRGYLAAYLDDHPDAVLQLTGGQDSRLLLSAIEPGRRRGLRVMTLGTPESPDVQIAAGLARRYSMEHEVIDLNGLGAISPEVAVVMVADAACRLEASADPIAEPVSTMPRVDVIVGSADIRPRGRGRSRFLLLRSTCSCSCQSRAVPAARQLAHGGQRRRRPGCTGPEFATWSRELAIREVHRALASTHRTWFDATDSLYLDHRMQRWAGATETAVVGGRRVVNPMLDDRFISTACALRPEDKRGARFLAQLQISLDEELASLPLDGRPAPRTYASPRWIGAAAHTRTTAGKIVRKAAQRLGGERRPPAGGDVLSGLLARHLREDDSMLRDAAEAGIFRSEWLDDVTSGVTALTPGTAALIVNLGAVAKATRADAKTTKLGQTDDLGRNIPNCDRFRSVSDHAD